MKRARILQTACTLASLMMLAASCSDETDTGTGTGTSLPEGVYPMTFTAAVDGQAVSRATTDNTWTGNEAVAIKIGNEVRKYKAASDGNLTIMEGDDPFYWQTANETKQVSAWYPYSRPYPTQWMVKANQNTSDNYQKSDLLKGELTLAFKDKDDPKENKITFYHQTAKVIVNLTAEEGIVLDEYTAVQLLNVGGVEGGGTTVTPYRPDNEKQTYLALVNKQEIRVNENFIRVSTGGNHYYYKPEETKTLSGGTAYTYDITVKNTGLEVTVSESIPWGTDGAQGSGSV